MKKLSAFMMIALLICSLFGTCMVTEAANANPPTFIVGTAHGGRGDTVTVTVSAANNPGIVSLKLDIGYDATVLQLKSITGGVFPSTSFGPITNNPIAVNWVDAVNPNNTTNGVIATLTFTIKDDAPLGKSAITVTYAPDDVYDFDFENVAFTNVNGLVTVEERADPAVVIGDVNGDGNVTITDMLLIKAHILKKSTLTGAYATAADANGDKKISIDDFIRIKAKVLGKGDTPA